MTDRRVLEYGAPASFKVYERNARTHSDAQITQVVASIRQFGFTNPLLVDEKGVVIAGHGRLRAALQMELAEIPFIRLTGLTASQRRALVIADNKIAMNASWDADLLRSELGDLRELGFDLAIAGFDDSELADIFATKKGKTQPDYAPPVPKKAVSRAGDIWLLGPHRVGCGDSTKAEDVAAVLAGAKPHLMVTDPPYGVNYDATWRGRAGVGSGGAAVGKVLNDDRADWRQAWALFPGAVAYVWHGGLHAGEVQQSLEAHEFRVRAQIVWVKTRLVLGRSHYHWQREPALYAVKDGADENWRFVPEHEIASYAVLEGKTADWHGGRKQSTVWTIEHIRSETGHSTQKPVECMKRPITNNSDPGQAVYDPFLGSGTTVIAAEMSGRVALGLELSPEHVDVIVRRWEMFTGKLAVLQGSDKGFEQVAKTRKVKLEAA